MTEPAATSDRSTPPAPMADRGAGGGSVMACLKAGTAVAHADAERQVGFGRMTSSVEGYAEVLAAFLGFYGPFEQLLAAAPRGRFRFEYRPRATAIAGDLRAIGASAEGVPACENLPRLDAPARLVGATYVLEGASLGGRIMARAVAERLGIGPAKGGAFLHGAGEETGPRWRAFGAAVEAAVGPDEIDAAVAAARKTFAAFGGWMAELAR